MTAMAETERAAAASVTRAGFPHFVVVPTRWMDNDVYGHVNNVVYYSYFDTVINRYLIEAGGLDIAAGPVIGVAAESHCRYRRAVAFPTDLEAGLRVAKLGRSSVRYEIGLFAPGDDEAAARWRAGLVEAMERNTAGVLTTTEMPWGTSGSWSG